MRAWLTLLILAGLSGGRVYSEETFELKEAVQAGAQTKTKLHLVLRGKIKLDQREENAAGQALLVYSEKAMEVTPDGLPSLVARFYEDGRAKFVAGRSEDPRQLRPEVRLAVGRSRENNLELWSPSGPYTSDELELIQDVLDTTQLTGLLPSKPVKAGDAWPIAEAVQCRLCDLDQFITSTLEAKLDSADDHQAKIVLTGKIHGLTYGSEVKSNVDAIVEFDRDKKMISKVTWKQIDSRAPSPVSPAGAYEVTITIERTPSDATALSDESLAKVDLKGSEGVQTVIFEDPKGRFRFLHDRQWHLTMLEKDSAILRRLDGNEMIAQLNINVVGDNANIAEISAEQLQKLMVEGSGLTIDEIIRSESVPTEGKFQLRLVTAHGSKGKVALTQRHFLARDPSGRQLLLTFLTEPAFATRLGDSDLSLVQSLEFLDRTASVGGPATKR